MDPLKVTVKTARQVINSQFASREPFQIVTITASTVLLTVWLYNFVFQDESVPERAKRAFFRWIKLIPAVKREIDSQLSKVRNTLEEDVKERTKHATYITALPDSGLDKSQIIEIVNDNLKYEELAAHRWKTEEDEYSLNVKKYHRFRSGGGPPSWPLFKIISFLKNKMVPAEQTDNLPIVDTEDTDEGGEQGDDEYIVTKRICDLRLRDNLLLEVEKKKLELLSQTAERQKELESEELNFLRSLIPYMEALEPITKLRLRIKIQQIIMDEMEAPIPTHLPHSTSMFNDQKQFYD